ncbi:MAG: leucyl/phenylalanyl-tRNA--protein transferase [Geminicoccaceae bacterium]
MLTAYAAGAFPMAEDRDSPVIHWIEPRQRGVFPLDAFHVPRRLARTFRRQPYAIAVDLDFPGVIRACAGSRPGRERTWLNDELIELYIELHRLGWAHSVECRRDGELVGGLYGVSLRGAFFGESMFSTATDASKLALVELVGRLRHGGFRLLDAQFVTEHLLQFGAIELPRSRYKLLLAQALASEATFPLDLRSYGLDVVGSGASRASGCDPAASPEQSSTQTS